MADLRRLLHISLATLALLATAPAVSGCGELKAGFAAAKEVNAEVKEELDIEVRVSFAVVDGDQTVSITLPEGTEADAATQKKIIEIARKHYPDAESIEISL